MVVLPRKYIQTQEKSLGGVLSVEVNKLDLL